MANYGKSRQMGNPQRNSLLYVAAGEASAIEEDIQCATRLHAENVHKSNMNQAKGGIYKNVLTFPRDPSYLKYFEKIPHPDRIPDELLALAELEAKKDLNMDIFQKQIEFDVVKKHINPYLSDLDRKLLLLPHAMRSLRDGEIDQEYRKAFSHLYRAFLNFFSSPLDNSIQPDIIWIDYPFAINSLPAQKALQELNINLFNPKAKLKLVEKLREAGAFADARRDFYFWNTDPANWSDISYQSRGTKYLKPYPPFYFSKHYLSPQFLALGNFTINAIPEGYVQPNKYGDYDICVNRIYYFINDFFNFEGDEDLGPVVLNPESGDPVLSLIEGTTLYNSDFRNFQRHGYGRYFPVLSRLHEVENFQPQCWRHQYAK